jgi:hypothetical protein
MIARREPPGHEIGEPAARRGHELESPAAGMAMCGS